MWLMLIGALIIAAPFVLTRYHRRAANRLRHASSAWDTTEKYGRVLLEDRHLDPEVGDFVEFTLNKAGSGTMTRILLAAIFSPWRSRTDDANNLFVKLSREQEQQLYRFIVAAMFYDSFRTIFSGSLLRRILYWMAATAADKTVPVSRAQVQPMFSAADRLCHSEAA